MSHTTRFARILTISILATLVLPAALPWASAQSQLSGAGSALASAQQKSVGVFDVAQNGRATGAVTQATIAEAAGSGGAAAGTGVIRDFGVASTGSGDAATKIFESIDIRGFTPTSRLEGVGTSALTLRSSGLVVTMTDTANSLLTFRNTGTADQEVVFNTAGDVVITATSAATNAWEVRGSGTSGALVLIGAKGEDALQKGSKLELTNAKKATATLKAGTQLIYRANADYVQGGAAEADQSVSEYNEVAVKALATGKLAGEATSEFATGASIVAQYNYYATATLRTEAQAAGRVTSQLKGAADLCGSVAGTASGAGSAAGSAPGATGSGSGSATGSASATACTKLQVVAYDLDYVDVAAQTSEQVAVYANGELMQRVEAAADVAARADTYWATTVEGRVLVLTNVAAKASAVTTITIAALAQGEVAASTLAELDAQSQVTTQLEGGFQLLGNLDASAQGTGQVIGTFGSFFASEVQGDATARDYTDVRTSTEIFQKIEFAADAAAEATAEFTGKAKATAAGSATSSTSAANKAAVSMVTKVAGNVVANAEFTDSVYASIIATAEASTLADFHLANDIDARLVGDAENVIALDGPAGEVGHLILMKADGSAVSSTRFDLTQANHVKAALQAGEQVVFRGAAEAHTRASAEAAAQAIAQGALASETSVGFVANAIASADVNYQTHVKQSIRTAADATHKGLVTLQVVNDAAGQAKATATVLVADRATLAAQTAADIAVTVDGKAAAAVSSAEEVFAAAQAAPSATAQAVYFVSTSLQGQTQVITSIPNLAAGATSTIVVTSTADVVAQAKSALDVFGSFQPGYGGVANGAIVDLIAKPEAGLILDYTVTAKSTVEGAAERSTMVFDAVKVGNSAFAAGSASSANSLRFTSDQAVVEAFDVSAATMKVLATADTVARMDLGSNIEATRVTDSVVFLKAPDFTGAIVLTKAATAQAAAAGNARSSLDLSQAASAGGIVTAHLEAGSQVVFKAFSGFEAELSEAEQKAQAEAIANGRLLGQVIVDTAQGTTAKTTSTANINYYSDVRAVTSVATADKIEVLVDSASSAGKVLIISLDRETVSGLIHGDAKLLVDGKEVDAITGEGAYQKVLNSQTDAYTILTTEGEVGLQAIVNLAHFSTRTITLETPAPPSVFLWTTLGLGVVVLGQAIYPRLRRKW